MEPTLERTPVDDDPIMEDREDTEEGKAPMEGERYSVSEERSSPDYAGEELADDKSVLTEANAADDALSTVKEEPSKEEDEAEEKASQESPPISMVKKDATPSMDDTLTLDATATTTNLVTGCPSPKYTQGFCGCFEI